MSAHFPAQPDGHRTEDDIKQDVLPPAVIDFDHVTIGDVTLPGKWIEQGGLTITPGSDSDLNRLTVTFLVGGIDVSDEVLRHVTVDPRPVDLRKVIHEAMTEWAEAVGATTPTA